MGVTPFQNALLVAYGAIVATWVLRHLVITRVYRRLDVLSRRSPRYRGTPPSVSAIIPARDEEASLPGCLASVRAQDYPGLVEILVADDRSVDRTPEIVREAEAADPRVRPVPIRDLPPGWTGKTHALHEATRRARGDWLWYVDADTLHAPESLSVMMEYARANGAALASLLPESRCETFWERVVQPLAGIILLRSYPLSRVNDDRDPLAFANGQYILIARDAYDEAGGHEAVRDRFVEDIGLARRVKASGRAIRCGITTDLGSTRMYTSLPAIVRGWSRILYDALDRRPAALLWKVAEPLIFSQSGDVALVVALGLLALGPAGWSAFAGRLLALALVHQILKQAVLWRMYAWSAPRTAAYALAYPLAGWVTAWICLKALAMCVSGRVTWRGTSYGPGVESEAAGGAAAAGVGRTTTAS